MSFVYSLELVPFVHVSFVYSLELVQRDASSRQAVHVMFGLYAHGHTFGDERLETDYDLM